MTKPVLDIILFSTKLAELVGWEGPGLVVAWYFFSGIIIRLISPAFGRLTALEQKIDVSTEASTQTYLITQKKSHFITEVIGKRKESMINSTNL